MTDAWRTAGSSALLQRRCSAALNSMSFIKTELQSCVLAYMDSLAMLSCMRSAGSSRCKSRSVCNDDWARTWHAQEKEQT